MAIEMKAVKAKNSHPKLNYCAFFFGSYFPYYAEIISFANIFETDENFIPTACMNVTNRGLNIYYNKNFFTVLSQEEVNWVMVHEIKHFLANHTGRFMKRDMNLSNICADMVIDSTISQYEMGEKNPKNSFFKIPVYTEAVCDVLKIPAEKRAECLGKNLPYFLPKEYDGKEIYEDVYDWFQQKKEEMKQNGKASNNESSNESGNGNQIPQNNGNKNSNGGNEEKESSNGGLSKGYGKNGKYEEEQDGTEDIIKRMIEAEKNADKEYTFDSHVEDEVSQESKEALVQEVIDRLKNRGLFTGTFEEQVNKLRPVRKNYLKDLQRYISYITGKIKDRTWTKENRMGLPARGNRKLKSKMTVGLDTSGSMGGTFNKVLEIIYRNDIEVNLIQGDTEVKKIDVIKKKYQLETLKIEGLGGTTLQPIVDYAVKHFPKLPFILMTDGYCDKLNFKGLRSKVLIITTDNPVEYTGALNVKQIVIPKENLPK